MTETKTEPVIAISHEHLMSLPIRRYEGPVHLVTTPETLAHARRVLKHERIVGLDTESRPAFRKGEVHPASLVQLATAEAVYLFSLKKIDCAAVLTELLENPKVTKAGIGLRDDFTKLQMSFPFDVKGAVELSSVAKEQGMGQPSARNLTGLYLGFRITKGQSTSNWARAELMPQQITYAATDAWVCRELYLCFEEKGFLSG